MTDAYLRRLEDEASVLPPAVARDIVSGVREELEGLTPAQARERIASLGDPSAIVGAARDELVGVPAAPTERRDSSAYTILTALAVSIGGVVVPLFGWIAGVGLLWWSRTWTLRDKIVGTLLVPAVLAAAIGVGMAFAAARDRELMDMGSGLAGGLFAYRHFSLIAGLVVSAIVALAYLLVRARAPRG